MRREPNIKVAVEQAYTRLKKPRVFFCASLWQAGRGDRRPGIAHLIVQQLVRAFPAIRTYIENTASVEPIVEQESADSRQILIEGFDTGRILRPSVMRSALQSFQSCNLYKSMNHLLARRPIVWGSTRDGGPATFPAGVRTT
ncbi:MAG TPA: hypothetical protein VHW00_05885 [Thermoanaerobaculia bacterium]|nr:hypothetical protein [Thermoanaerobaculia bacterium]